MALPRSQGRPKLHLEGHSIGLQRRSNRLLRGRSFSKTATELSQEMVNQDDEMHLNATPGPPPPAEEKEPDLPNVKLPGLGSQLRCTSIMTHPALVRHFPPCQSKPFGPMSLCRGHVVPLSSVVLGALATWLVFNQREAHQACAFRSLPREAEKMAEEALVKEPGLESGGLKTEEEEPPEEGDITREIMHEEPLS